MRPYTKEEVRELFLAIIQDNARYWAELPGLTPQERCDGVTFSILTLLDGSRVGFPAVDIVLSPYQDDENDAMENGADWFKQGMVINDDCMLHEIWATFRPDSA